VSESPTRLAEFSVFYISKQAVESSSACFALASYDSDNIQASLLGGFSVAVVAAGVSDTGWQKKIVHPCLLLVYSVC
jgi:hypothetical protein